jgi:hypothetical protein
MPTTWLVASADAVAQHRAKARKLQLPVKSRLDLSANLAVFVLAPVTRTGWQSFQHAVRSTRGNRFHRR